MATYFRPPGRNTARSVALTPWSGGLMLTTWPGPVAWNFNGSSLTQVTLPTLSYLPFGFTAASENGLGEAWIAGYFGGAIRVSGLASSTAFPYPTGDFFTGAAYASGHTYFLRSNGDVFSVIGGIIAQISGSFGEEAVSLTASGATLYAALPTSSRMGILALTTPVSGVASKVAAPMTVPAAVTASASGTALVGWDYAAIASGFTDINVSPTGDHAVAVASGVGSMVLLGGIDPNWQIIQVVSGITNPRQAIWVSSGEQVLLTKGGAVNVYNLNLGALVAGPTITLTNPHGIAATPDGLTALVCLTAANMVQVLKNVANTWTTHETITINNGPNHILDVSATEMVCDYAPGGTGGGLNWLSLVSATWQSVATVTGLGFSVSGIALDTNNTVYAVGTTGSIPVTSGNLVAATPTGVINSLTWIGRSDAVFYEQGQIAVVDNGA